MNAWTSASGLMAVILCVACGHAVWAIVLLGGLEHGPSLPKHVKTCCEGYWRMDRGPMVC